MARPVSEEPQVTIIKWGILQDPIGFRLAGFHGSTGVGRITSPIVEFDEHARVARTESGRLYHLSGEPDPDVTAMIAHDHMRRYGLTVRQVAMAEVWEVALALAPRPQGPGGVN